MSHLPIIEWSPESCLYLDPSTHRVHSATTPVEALSALGRPKKVVLALGRRQIFIKTLRLPDVSIEEAKNLLRFRVEELFPLPAHEIAYDLVFTDDKNSEGRLAVVFAAKSETVRQTTALFAHAGAKVEQVIPASLGASFIAEIEPTTVLVASSSDGTSFDVVDHGALLYSRVANHVTTQAEIDSEVARAIASADVDQARTVVHTALRELVSSNTPLADQHPLEILSQRHPHINLRLPEDIAKELNKAVMGRRQLAVLLLCALFCVAALAWWDRDDAERKVAKERAETTRVVNRLKDKHSLITSQLAKYETESAMVRDGLEPRQSLSDVVTVAVNSVPDGLWLTGMTLERGKDITLRGTAKSNALVAGMVDALSASSRLRDVELVFSNNNAIGEIPVVQFSIKAHVVGNMPLIDPKKERRRK